MKHIHLTAPEEALAKRYKKRTSKTIKEFKSTLVEIEAVVGDLLFGRGVFDWTIEAPGAPGPISESGKWCAMFRRGPDGTWLIARNIWNLDSPA